jgi:hypothetical protein
MTDAASIDLGATGIGSAMAAQVAQIRTTQPSVLAIALCVLDSLPQLNSMDLVPIINGLQCTFGGCTVYISKQDKRTPSELDLQIWARFNGRNWGKLATEFEITVVEVYTAINRASAWHRSKTQAIADQHVAQGSTEQTAHQAADPHAPQSLCDQTVAAAANRHVGGAAQTRIPAGNQVPPSPQSPTADPQKLL